MTSLIPDETILGLLAIQARHGYELLECFRSTQQLGRVWNLSTSQIYAVLKRLEREGWVIGREETPPNAPPRTKYTVSEIGKARLLAWLHEAHPSASIRRIRVEFLSRLYIAQHLHIPTASLVQHQRESCHAKLAQLRAERDQARQITEHLALELHIGQLEAVLRWIERCQPISNPLDNLQNTLLTDQESL